MLVSHFSSLIVQILVFWAYSKSDLILAGDVSAQRQLNKVKETDIEKVTYRAEQAESHARQVISSIYYFMSF
jgi:hypothetical protein